MLVIHILSKRNDSVNIILLCTLHDQVSVLFIIYLFILCIYVFIYLFTYLFIYLLGKAKEHSKAPCKIKKSVNDWRNPFKNKKYLYFPSFHIHKPFAKMAIQTSRLKNILNLHN